MSNPRFHEIKILAVPWTCRTCGNVQLTADQYVTGGLDCCDICLDDPASPGEGLLMEAGPRQEITLRLSEEAFALRKQVRLALAHGDTSLHDPEFLRVFDDDSYPPEKATERRATP